MTTLTIIWNWIKKHYVWVLAVLVILFLCLFLNQCSKNAQLKKEAEQATLIANQNYAALTDSIKKEVNKIGDSVYSKHTFVVNKLAELEKLNSDLYNQLDKTKGDIMLAIKGIAVATTPPVAISNSVVKYNDKLYGLKFENHFVDGINFKSDIIGESRFTLNNNVIGPDSTFIRKNSMELSITYGMRENKDQYEVFAISPSKYVTIKDLDGAYVIKKQICQPAKIKHWGLGPSIGFGLTTDLKAAGYIGLSLQYNLIRF